MGIFGVNIEKLKSRKDINGLIKVLRTNMNNSIRLRAILALLDIDDSATIEPLRSMLNDPNWIMRHFSATMLDEMNIEIETHLKADYLIAGCEWEMLIDMGEAAVDSLLTHIRDKSLYVRTEIIKCLAIIGDPKAFLPLLELFKYYQSENTFICTLAQYIGEFKDERAVKTLRSLLKGEDTKVSAAIGIGKIGKLDTLPDLISSLDEDDLQNQMRLAASISIMGEDVIEELILEFKKTDNDRIRQGIAMALSRLGSNAERYLLSFLSDEKGPVRAWSAFSLSLSTNKENFNDNIIPLLDDEDNNVREKAIIALGTIGNENVSAKIISKLDDSNHDVRIAAIKVLGTLKSEESICHLVKLFNDSNEDVKDAASESLGEIGKLAPKKLTDCLSEANDSEIVGIISSLGKISDKGLYDYIEPFLNSENNEICKSAISALGAIGNERAVGQLIKIIDTTKDIEIKAAAVLALGLFKTDQAIDIVSNYIDDRNNDVRWNAYMSLSSTHDAKALRILKSRIDTKDLADSFILEPLLMVLLNELDAKILIEELKDNKIKEKVMDVISGIGESMVEPLIHAISTTSDKYHLHAIALSLFYIGNSSIKPLIFSLRNEDKQIRSVSLFALEIFLNNQ